MATSFMAASTMTESVMTMTNVVAVVVSMIDMNCLLSMNNLMAIRLILIVICARSVLGMMDVKVSVKCSD